MSELPKTGISRETVTNMRERCSTDTTLIVHTRTVENQNCFVVLARRWFYLREKRTLCSFGDDSKARTGKRGSTARCSATNRESSPRRSFWRPKKLHGCDGSANDCLPTSRRGRSNHLIPATAFSARAGESAALRNGINLRF